MRPPKTPLAVHIPPPPGAQRQPNMQQRPAPSATRPQPPTLGPPPRSAMPSRPGPVMPSRPGVNFDQGYDDEDYEDEDDDEEYEVEDPRVNTRRTAPAPAPSHLPFPKRAPTPTPRQPTPRPRPGTSASTSTHPPFPPLPKPTLRLLFSHLTPRERWIFLYPAILITSLTAGSAPFMTQVVGDAFDAFALFPTTSILSPNPPTPAQISLLLSSLQLSSIELAALGLASLIGSMISASLWVRVGERNVRHLKERVFVSVMSREMEWFDLEMMKVEEESRGTGAGGMMYQFTSDTDEVRQASSLASGQLLEHLLTSLVAIILAFTRAPLLTLVILCPLPLILLVNGTLDILSLPTLKSARLTSSRAGARAARALTLISTVKAHCASALEATKFEASLTKARDFYKRCSVYWGAAAGMIAFVLTVVFVSGFWYGAVEVNRGALSPGAVMGTFWACLIAASNLQMCTVLVVAISKGKVACASLCELIDQPGGHWDPLPIYESRAVADALDAEEEEEELEQEAARDTNAKRWLQPPHQQAQAAAHMREREPSALSLALRRSHSHTRANGAPSIRTFMGRRPIAPSLHARFQRPRTLLPGTVDLSRITFAYPTRPEVNVLKDVTLFFPAGELSFVVGGSGSGKSTLAALLCGLYMPQEGQITVDGDVALVTQGAGVVLDMSVRENIAVAAPRSIRERRVEMAVEEVMLMDFVRGLEGGMNARLGREGGGMSGGQRQRLALARARVRNPAVLVLDEATSALDPAARLLIFNALKNWRRGKTTIVITHDLASIQPEAFAYVLKDGQLVEQGFAQDLAAVEGSEFRRIAAEQREGGGGARVLGEREMGWDVDVGQVIQEEWEESRERRGGKKRATMAAPMFGIADAEEKEEARMGRPKFYSGMVSITPPPPNEPLPTRPKFFSGFLMRQKSVNNTRPTPRALEAGPPPPQGSPAPSSVEDDLEMRYLERTAAEAMRARSVRLLKKVDRSHAAPTVQQDRWGQERARIEADAKRRAQEEKDALAVAKSGRERVPSFLATMRRFWWMIPGKGRYFFGLALALANGAMVPIFSFFLAKLLALVAGGAPDMSQVTFFAIIVLCLSIGSGVTMALKVYIVETHSQLWMDRLRARAYRRTLLQDRAWHDIPAHTAPQLVQTIMKDADDTQFLLQTIFPQMLTVTTMLTAGYVWAIIIGWQLALLGIAIGPAFAFLMSIQRYFLQQFEIGNKKALEEVGGRYFEALTNIRAIRGMGIDQVIEEQFCYTLDKAYLKGINKASLAGCSFGLVNCLIFQSEAVLFYVGGVLVVQGSYDYAKMVQVLTLVIFSLSNAAQVMSFLPRMTKSCLAANAMGDLAELPENTSDTKGDVVIETDGDIKFDNVSFAYPIRPEAPVLNRLSFTLRRGECVAIVGPSGSGKSTIAALLQRLYEPTSGAIRIDKCDIRTADIRYLRNDIAVVSQDSALFDGSILENITYGAEYAKDVPIAAVVAAAQAALAHDFIMAAPNAYDASIGEDGILLSGGQAQRIQIARALLRDAPILIFDECTSALDGPNEKLVMDTIRNIKGGHTSLMITHKVPLMQLCDRILVLHEGAIAEEGTYNSLMNRRGLFWTLASAGEWAG